MSTFDGVIKEYPLISIDRFLKDEECDNYASTVYFLSHCHTDHMSGLEDKEFYEHLKARSFSKIYVSDVTECLLKSDPLYFHLSNFIVNLRLEQPAIINLPDTDGKIQSNVVVTMLTAGHCPGSVMILIEGNNGRILYTGDFRLPIGGSARLLNMHEADGSLKRLDSLYIDTTFCNKNSQYIPTREECLDAIISLVQPWIRRGPNYIVHFFCPAQYAYEFVFVELFKKFRVKTHVTEERERKYAGIKEIENAVTSISNEAQIHACIYEKTWKDRKPVYYFTSPCGYCTDDLKPILDLLSFIPCNSEESEEVTSLSPLGLLKTVSENQLSAETPSSLPFYDECYIMSKDPVCLSKVNGKENIIHESSKLKKGNEKENIIENNNLSKGSKKSIINENDNDDFNKSQLNAVKHPNKTEKCDGKEDSCKDVLPVSGAANLLFWDYNFSSDDEHRSHNSSQKSNTEEKSDSETLYSTSEEQKSNPDNYCKQDLVHAKSNISNKKLNHIFPKRTYDDPQCTTSGTINFNTKSFNKSNSRNFNDRKHPFNHFLTEMVKDESCVCDTELRTNLCSLPCLFNEKSKVHTNLSLTNNGSDSNVYNTKSKNMLKDIAYTAKSSHVNNENSFHSASSKNLVPYLYDIKTKSSNDNDDHRNHNSYEDELNSNEPSNIEVKFNSSVTCNNFIKNICDVIEDGASNFSLCSPRKNVKDISCAKFSYTSCRKNIDKHDTDCGQEDVIKNNYHNSKISSLSLKQEHGANEEESPSFNLKSKSVQGFSNVHNQNSEIEVIDLFSDDSPGDDNLTAKVSLGGENKFGLSSHLVNHDVGVNASSNKLSVPHAVTTDKSNNIEVIVDSSSDLEDSPSLLSSSTKKLLCFSHPFNPHRKRETEEENCLHAEKRTKVDVLPDSPELFITDCSDNSPDDILCLTYVPFHEGSTDDL
ncbi:probable cyclin-dependent serine/threonine-protein kinase DDB_G0292550 isoform X2 [Stegodyphus dumicola]|uniref:probable cyclin-dependent serine/threonine-protein kinase DDB_G0292550 isoform X2 n=1 Tax=Stegodyphus dumicola TaxID=202533 RepID=UPI0015AEEAFF|nr:probable cyclin-dependent serine/threonine-protein kinase DDB_G0292550 isoform X2 [Stegodyphus dumicola]